MSRAGGGAGDVRRRAVFLDRDGVLNRASVRDGIPRPPETPDDLHVLPGVEEACAALHARGFLLLVVTNQPDVARGTQRLETVEELNGLLADLLPLDEIVVCAHDDTDRCACRKPLPGMLLDAAARWNVDLGESFMVGDRWRDVEAGRRAGCTTVFLDRGYAEPVPEAPDVVVRDLREAVSWILASTGAPAEAAR